jgi:probable rRNA maturation factor
MSAARARSGALTVEVIVQSDVWRREPEAKKAVRRAVRAAADSMRLRAGAYEICVALADNAAVRALNREWRGKDAPTNVLSFPAPSTPGAAAASLGDIVIAYETVAREAKAERKPFLHHLSHLAVHGFLHLLGQDHQDEAEAAEMEAAERAILARLDIPDPYRPPLRARAGA